MRSIGITYINYVFVLFLVFIPVASFSQKLQKGVIYMSDGEIKEGFVEVPKRREQKRLLFKVNNNSQEMVIKCNDIDGIQVYSRNGDSYFFENIQIRNQIGQLSRKKLMMFVAEKGYATLYLSASNYKVNREGKIIILDHYRQTIGPTAGYSELPEFYFYIRKKGESEASFFVMSSPAPTYLGLNKALKKNAVKYLFEYPELVDRIKDKEFKHKDTVEIIELYNAFMENK